SAQAALGTGPPRGPAPGGKWIWYTSATTPQTPRRHAAGTGGPFPDRRQETGADHQVYRRRWLLFRASASCGDRGPTHHRSSRTGTLTDALAQAARTLSPAASPRDAHRLTT